MSTLRRPTNRANQVSQAADRKEKKAKELNQKKEDQDRKIVINYKDYVNAVNENVISIDQNKNVNTSQEIENEQPKKKNLVSVFGRMIEIDREHRANDEQDSEPIEETTEEDTKETTKETTEETSKEPSQERIKPPSSYPAYAVGFILHKPKNLKTESQHRLGLKSGFSVDADYIRQNRISYDMFKHPATTQLIKPERPVQPTTIKKKIQRINPYSYNDSEPTLKERMNITQVNIKQIYEAKDMLQETKATEKSKPSSSSISSSITSQNKTSSKSSSKSSSNSSRNNKIVRKPL
jgi:hypothetical protein